MLSEACILLSTSMGRQAWQEGIAGWIAGNFTVIVLALTQMSASERGVVSHGWKKENVTKRSDFNQAKVLAIVTGSLLIVGSGANSDSRA